MPHNVINGGASGGRATRGSDEATASADPRFFRHEAFDSGGLVLVTLPIAVIILNYNLSNYYYKLYKKQFV